MISMVASSDTKSKDLSSKYDDHQRVTQELRIKLNDTGNQFKRRVESFNSNIESVSNEIVKLKLQGYQNEVKEIFNISVDGLIILDAKGIIKSCNNSIDKIFDINNKDFVGCNISKIAPELTLTKLKESKKLQEFSVNSTNVLVSYTKFKVYDDEGNEEDNYLLLLRQNLDSLLQEFNNKSHVIVDILNNHKAGIVVTDPKIPDNPIIYVNEGFTRLTGYTAEEVKGKNCRFLQYNNLTNGMINKTNHPDIAKLFNISNDTTEINFEILNFKKDGTPFYNSLNIIPVLDKHENIDYYIGIQYDITERIKLSKELNKRDVYSNTLKKLSNYLNVNNTNETTINYILSILGDVTEVDRVTFSTIDLDNNQFNIHYQWNKNEDNRSLFKNSSNLDLSHINLINLVPQLRKNNNITFDVDECDEGTKEILENNNIKTCSIFPIVYDNEIENVMIFSNTENKKIWKYAEIEIINSICNLISSKIHKQKVLKRLHISEKKLKLTYNSLDNIPQSVFITNKDGDIVYSNRSFYESLNLDQKDVQNLNFDHLQVSYLSDNTVQGYADYWQKLKSKNEFIFTIKSTNNVNEFPIIFSSSFIYVSKEDFAIHTLTKVDSSLDLVDKYQNYIMLLDKHLKINDSRIDNFVNKDFYSVFTTTSRKEYDKVSYLSGYFSSDDTNINLIIIPILNDVKEVIHYLVLQE